MKIPATLCALAAIGFTAQLALADLPSTYTDPSQAMQLIQRAQQLPQSRSDEKVFYADGISHFDNFIPFSPFLKESAEPNKPTDRYTFHDGRISSVEILDQSGQVLESCVVWNNRAGAPVLTADRNKDGSYGIYEYAEYDSSGKIQKTYRFSGAFKLLLYSVFTYKDDVTSIQEYDSHSNPRMQTIYDHGDLFIVQNGKKDLVNHVDRQEEIRRLEKFGLKPLYPDY